MAAARVTDASWYAGRRVLVTGHTGFKGAWLAAWLSRAGADLTGYGLPPPDGTQNLYGAAKKWVVFFKPRLVFASDGGARYVDRFFSLYPDGRVISIVREPKSWFPSAQGWAVKETSKRPSQTDSPAVVAAMGAWTGAVRELLQIREEHPDRMALVRFDDLLEDTAGTMRALSGWLGIGNSRACRTPTFNGLPAAPNTSFKIDGTGIAKDPLTREVGLAEADRLEIDRLSGDLMQRVAEHGIRPLRKETEKKGRRAAGHQVELGSGSTPPADLL